MAEFYERLTPLSFIKTHLDDEGEIRSIWLGKKSLILMLEKSQEQPRERVERGAGIFLLAFELLDEDRLRQELSQSKITIESETDSTIYIRDPEGNRLGFSTYPGRLKKRTSA